MGNEVMAITTMPTMISLAPQKHILKSETKFNKSDENDLSFGFYGSIFWFTLTKCAQICTTLHHVNCPKIQILWTVKITDECVCVCVVCL